MSGACATTVYTGTIESSIPGGYQIPWDEGENHQSAPDSIEPDMLVLESQLQKLKETLEKEFKRTKRLIKAKMKVSTKTLKEAGKLASSIGYQLADLGVSRGLLNEMDKAGWHSSWDC